MTNSTVSGTKADSLGAGGMTPNSAEGRAVARRETEGDSKLRAECAETAGSVCAGWVREKGSRRQEQCKQVPGGRSRAT